MNIDPYGRTWHYTHSFPYTKLLQISPQLARDAFNADRSLRGSCVTYSDYEKDYGHLEPYLIRDLTGWVMGMRYGNAPHEYISPMLDERIISLTMDRHRATAPFGEHHAVISLT